MIYQKDNRFGNLIVHLEPLDIMVVVQSQQKIFHHTYLAKPKKVFGMFTLVHFLMDEKNLAPSIIRTLIILS
jgi:hypothetical protein